MASYAYLCMPLLAAYTGITYIDVLSKQYLACMS